MAGEAKTTMSARDEIAAERRRQVEAEGWTPDHDDGHSDGSMADAARVYLHGDPQTSPVPWPWDWKWWKPRGRRRDLIRAGALAQAEIDRLVRQRARSSLLSLTTLHAGVSPSGARAWHQHERQIGAAVALKEAIVAEIERLDREAVHA